MYVWSSFVCVSRVCDSKKKRSWIEEKGDGDDDDDDDDKKEKEEEVQLHVQANAIASVHNMFH